MPARTIFIAAICAASLLAAAYSPAFATSQDNPSEEAKMILTRNGSQPSIKGPDDWFVGSVRIDPIHLEAQEPSRLTSAIVTFEPGARTNWHTHPLGQLLIVTSGKGWTQCEGEPRVEINAGDTIWCPPGHKHWHGATSDTAMSHIAVQEMLDGKNVEWLEPVSDAQYGN
jgi:quercetin dioxygenase-like cupin family protein